jgi:hypothetical protein
MVDMYKPVLDMDIPTEVLTTLKRKDLKVHIATDCYLRPYQCEFCGLKDAYEAITGNGLYEVLQSYSNPYGGHQAMCPEAPLTCTNECGSSQFKRKDMKDHHSQCPREPVECPFAEAGCKMDVRRQQLENHVTTSLQQHLMLLMIDRKQLKKEWLEMKTELNDVKAKLSKEETERDKIKVNLHETEDRLAFCEANSNLANKLKKFGHSVKITMLRFSEYRRSGKVWHSPPFYDEGYKMCLAVHANGVGRGAGTHVSVALTLLKGEHDSAQHRSGSKKCSAKIHGLPEIFAGQKCFNVCQYQPLSQYSEAVKELSHDEIFCTHKYIVSKLVNDCLTFNIKYYSECYLKISVN